MKTRASTAVADRASQLIADGKVSFTARDNTGRPCRARVGAYDVVKRGTRWVCDCEAGHYRQTCSHSVAAEIVAREG